MKLVNLNTWHGGKYLWDNIVEYLRAEDPDILMLQEAYASKEPGQAPFLNTAQSIQGILDLPYSEFAQEFMLSTPEDHAPMGNAILSRFPLTHVNTVWLHGNGPTEVNDLDRAAIPNIPRNMLHCQTEIKGQTYNLLNTHGVWAPDSKETDSQQEMGRIISDYIQDMTNVILAGDFNTNENTSTMSAIRENLVDIFSGERKSSFNMKHKTNPGYATAVVDFIFVSPNIRVLEHRTSERDVSDHQSQIVILDL
jgi:endonuclease/exonuclease/phosphatase family metal-dependent hydrolase